MRIGIGSGIRVRVRVGGREGRHRDEDCTILAPTFLHQNFGAATIQIDTEQFRLGRTSAFMFLPQDIFAQYILTQYILAPRRFGTDTFFRRNLLAIFDFFSL